MLSIEICKKYLADVEEEIEEVIEDEVEHFAEHGELTTEGEDVLHKLFENRKHCCEMIREKEAARAAVRVGAV